MKIKAIVTINMGLYMDIRPEIEIDTEKVEEAKKLIISLHKHFYKLLETSKMSKYVKHDKIDKKAKAVDSFVNDLGTDTELAEQVL